MLERSTAVVSGMHEVMNRIEHAHVRVLTFTVNIGTNRACQQRKSVSRIGKVIFSSLPVIFIVMVF